MKNKFVIWLLAIVSLVSICIIWSHGVWPGTFKKDFIYYLFASTLAVTLGLALSYSFYIDKTKEDISSKTKELLLFQANNNTSGLYYLKEFIRDFKLETNDKVEIDQIEIVATSSLVKRYYSSETLEEFYQKISDDFDNIKNQKDINNIFLSSIKDIKVVYVFKKLFSVELNDAISKNSLHKSKILWSWTLDKLALFEPFKEFTEELSQIKKIIQSAKAA